jgi:hypothetical protein
VVSGRRSAIVGRQLYQDTRDLRCGEIYPGSIVRPGPEPMALMGTIPVALVEENIHVDVRNRVDVGPGYYDHRRGSREDVSRRRADVDVDLHPGRCLFDSTMREERPEQQGQHCYSTNTSSHFLPP